METIIKVKKPYVEIIFIKKDVTLILGKYLESVRYTDYEKGQSDELELVLLDFEHHFFDDWYPQKGDKISAKIGFIGEQLLNCGNFTVDEISFDSSDEGDKCTIRALAASINNKIREKASKSYVSKTLIQIAKEIGAKHGFTVVGSQGFIKIPHASQYNETDLAFLNRISEEYGYIFKLTDTVLTFTKVESLEEAKPLKTLKKADITRLSLNDTSAKTYTACRVQYYNPKKGKYITYTEKGNKKDVKNEVLKLDVKCQTKEQAIAKAKAGLRNGQTTLEGSIEFKEGNRTAVAGANFNLTEYYKLNGKYHITQSSHTVTDENWNCSAEVKKIA